MEQRLYPAAKIGADVPLEDMHAAYYGYSVVESRVWISGVKDLSIEIK